MNDYQKFLRQRKILIAAIIFCVAIIVFGSGYIVLKLDPEFSILPGVPEILVDPGDEIGDAAKPEPDDETEPHTEPTDPDNTGGPATPETPSTPETPATPETPSTPVTPPTTPTTPTTPTAPTTPTTPTTPTAPTTPTTPTTPTEPDHEPTQAEINDIYRQLIQNKFKLTIKYGDENGNYAPIPEYVPVKLYDENTIHQYLLVIDSIMSMYPDGFFQEMVNSGMTLNIYIVKTIGGRISGLTETWSNGYVTIMLQSDDGRYFAETMHHELMHYIDGYMKIAKRDLSAEANMNALNPAGYSYGDTNNNNYVYIGNNAATSYFMSSYSKTNFMEDRATIFSDMMTRATCPAYYTNGYPLNEKAKSIAQQIDNNFITVNAETTEFWERCIAY